MEEASYKSGLTTQQSTTPITGPEKVNANDQGSNLGRVIAIVLVAIAATALAFAEIKFGLLTAGMGIMIAHPIVSAIGLTITLVAAGFAVWVVFHKKESSPKELNLKEMAIDQLAKLPLEQLKSMSITDRHEYLNRFAAKDSELAANFQRMEKTSQLQYLLALGEFNNEDLNNLKKRSIAISFCESYKTVVVDNLQALEDDSNSGIEVVTSHYSQTKIKHSLMQSVAYSMPNY